VYVGYNFREKGTFLRNHVPHIAAMDLFVAPTIAYVLAIVRLAGASLHGAYG
jgi:hypothetical protein